MNTRRTIVKILVFTALSGLLTTVVFATLLNIDSNSQHSYSAVFTDASGLQSGDDVMIAGVKVGKVSSVALQGLTARVGFSVDSNQQVTTHTLVSIKYADLLGRRFLALGKGAPGGQPLAAGTQIPIERTTNGLDLTAVFNGFQPLFSALSPGQINQLTGSIIDVFQGQSGTVDSLVSETADITNNLAARTTVIDQVLENLAGLLNAVGSKNVQLAQLVDGLDTLLTGLANNKSQLTGTIENIGQLTTKVGSILAQAQQGPQNALGNDITQLATAAGALANETGPITNVLNGLPAALNAAAKVMNSGNYVNAYVCNLTVNISEPASGINISLIPGVSAPQYPDPIYIPTLTTSTPLYPGQAPTHTAVCS